MFRFILLLGYGGFERMTLPKKVSCSASCLPKFPSAFDLLIVLHFFCGGYFN